MKYPYRFLFTMGFTFFMSGCACGPDRWAENLEAQGKVWYDGKGGRGFE